MRPLVSRLSRTQLLTGTARAPAHLGLLGFLTVLQPTVRDINIGNDQPQ